MTADNLFKLGLSIFQAFLGTLLFGEELSIRWWLGTVLIVSGIALLGRDDKVKSD